jgi:hypothetical protein
LDNLGKNGAGLRWLCFTLAQTAALGAGGVSQAWRQ